jgi:predicted regulator of Ras-like GTPase activity (Roadblock/LC7/MglB family)
MTFGEVLQDATHNVEGLVAAALVGLDGIGVETVLAEGVEGVNAEELEVELATLVSGVNRTLKNLSAGKAKEVIVEGDNLSYFISMVDGNYFVAYVLQGNANLGRARFEVRRATQRIRENF